MHSYPYDKHNIVNTYYGLNLLLLNSLFCIIKRVPYDEPSDELRGLTDDITIHKVLWNKGHV